MTKPIPRWVRPTNCDTNTCAEVMRGATGAVFIRNSTKPSHVVHLTSAEWEALRADIAAGGLGNLAGI